jgi:hypothetical protein
MSKTSPPGFTVAAARVILIPASVQSLERGWCTGKIGGVQAVNFAPGSVLSRVGDSAFSGFQSLRQIVLPASVEVIGSSCFEGCDNLEVVSFASPSKLREIGSSALSELPGLCSITLPASLEVLGEHCFSNSRSLGRVAFERGSKLRKIEENCFYRVSRMESITIPASVQVLGSCCFMSIECLEKVTFEAGSQLKAIEAEAFKNNGSLTSITIPPSVEVIQDGCFWDCTCLKTVTFARGSKIQSLGYRAFMNCRALKGISIPPSLEVVGKYCFGKCKAFTNITFQGASRLRELRSLPINGIAQVDIPDSVQILGCHGKIPDRRRLVIQFGRGSKLKTLAFYEKGGTVIRVFVRLCDGFVKDMRKRLEFDPSCAPAQPKEEIKIPGMEGFPADFLRFMHRPPPGEWSDEEIDELDSIYGGMYSDSDDW